jgi:hypothetical protein
MGTSAAGPDPASGPVPESLTDKQSRIYRYLRSRVDGRAYFKSRLIAEDLGLSAKEVGANMAAVDAAGSLSVEKWGYSSGTTWMVTD